MSKILIGVDGSERSEDALAFGRSLALAADAPVVLAMAHRLEPLRPGAEEHEAFLRQDAERTLARLAVELEDVSDVVLRPLVANTSPAHALQATAEEEQAGIIVVGSSHTGRLGRVLPGRTAERLLHGAPCPVAVVPLGYRTHAARSRPVIRKSADGGRKWGRAHDLGYAPTGMTPSAPVIHDGRIWLQCGGRRAMSARLGRGLLSASAWTRTNPVPQNGRWFPALKEGDNYWSESQVVSSPRTGVVLLPKTHELPMTALLRVTSPARATFDPQTGLVCLPGAEKKFACVYDEQSDRFWALTNPVLPEHDGEGAPALIRNTGALLSSPDLRTWSDERVFLYSPNVSGEAFQYFAFAVDGDDLAVVARTALNVGGRKPPRGHDANLLSFHVIKNFRSSRREQVLVSDTGNDRVVRFEANLTCRLAPLGRFTRRTLTKPMGVAQGPDGDVYVCEQVDRGRVLRYTPRGALKAVIAREGLDFRGRPESLTVAADGRLFMTVAFGSNSNKVYRIDPATGRVTLLIRSSFASRAGSGTLRNPRGIAIGPRAHLFVADRGNDRIREFDPSTGEFLGNLTEDQRRPQALAWEPARGRLLFSRRTTDADHDIARVRPNGRVLTLYTRKDVGPALGVASVGRRIYWTDYDNDRIYVVTSERDKEKATSVRTGLDRPGNLAPVARFPAGRLGGPCHRPRPSP